MPPLPTRAIAILAAVAGLVCPAAGHADPPPPIDVPASVPAAIDVIFSLTGRVDVAKCRRTLAEAQIEQPDRPPSPYQVKVPLLTMTRQLPTASDPTTYYLESDSVSAKVPDYCPAATKVVIWIEDVAPAAQPIYSTRARPGRNDVTGRSASASSSLRVPYLGLVSQRPVAYVTVHAEAWNGRDAAGRYAPGSSYYCQEFDYTILGLGVAPRQDAVRDCAAQG